MRKILIFLILIVYCFGLTSCDKYEEYAGVYESFYSSNYYQTDKDYVDYTPPYFTKYNRFTLNANGSCIVECMQTNAGHVISKKIEGTFTIANNEIIIIVREGTNSKEYKFDYYNGEIQISGMYSNNEFYNVKFRRNK